MRTIAVIKQTHGACSVQTVVERSGMPFLKVSAQIVQAIKQGLLVEHPTIPNIYGLPKWYEKGIDNKQAA